MTNPRIETIPMLPFGMLNAFLLIKGDSAILVDTGLPNSARRVEKALKKNGLGWSNLRLIVLTHAHIDHAGSAADLRDLSAAPIIAHEAELAYCQGRTPIFLPTRWFGRLFRMTGAIQRPFRYFTPDLIVSGDGHDLSDYGISARLLFTPGHTPGSLSLLLEDGGVLAGDLAASGILLGGIARKNRPIQPPFEETPRQVAASLRLLLSLGCTRFFLGHGGPLTAREIDRHIRNLDAKS